MFTTPPSTHDQAELDRQRELEEFFRLKREQVNSHACIYHIAENKTLVANCLFGENFGEWPSNGKWI